MPDPMTDRPLHLEAALKENGVLYYTTVGDSMAPLLRTHRNTVVLRTPTEEVKRGDVILFHRPGGAYVLHRVIRVTNEGYETRGDNRRHSDRFVPKDCLLAVMDGYYKKKRFISPTRFSYRLYVRVWGMPNPLRRLCLFTRDALRRLVGKPSKG